MREHMGIFRGKRLVDGKWVQGAFCPKEFIPLKGVVDCAQIIRLVEPCDGIWFDVDPNTVGECTGLTDKNGKLIFEGDVVRMPHEYTTTEKIKGCYGYDSEGYPQRIPGYTGSGEYPTVKRGFKNCPVKFNPSRGFYAEGTSFFLSGINVEVIGNVADNPELLERR